MKQYVQFLRRGALFVNVIIPSFLLLFHMKNALSELAVLKERKCRNFLQFLYCSPKLGSERVFEPVNNEIELNDEQGRLFDCKASIWMNFGFAPGFGTILFSRVQVTFNFILFKLFLSVRHGQK